MTIITALEKRPTAKSSQLRLRRARTLQTTDAARETQSKKGAQARFSICLTLLVSQERYSPVSRLW